MGNLSVARKPDGSLQSASQELPQPSNSAAPPQQAGPSMTADDVERNIMQHHSQILSTIEARNETMLRHLADNNQQQQQHDALKSLVDEQRRYALLVHTTTTKEAARPLLCVYGSRLQ